MKKTKLNKIKNPKNKWIGKDEDEVILLNIDVKFEYEKAIPRADEIAVVIKFKTINAPKDESILCLLNKWPIDIDV